MLLETKNTSVECKEITEDGKGEDPSIPVQIASAVTSEQVVEVTGTENHVLSSSPTDDMLVEDAISYGDVAFQIPVPRSASAVTSEQVVEIAGTVNHVLSSPAYIAESVMDCMVVEDVITYEEVERHNPVQIQVPKSTSTITSEKVVNVATVNHTFSSPVHATSS